jgi:chaperonin GroEL
MGVMMSREAAENTNRAAGDGTTSTIAIEQSLMNDGYKLISTGMNPVLLKKGMDAACDKGVELLNEISSEVKTEEDKLNIATVSANNDRKLGELIVGVVNEIGTDGVITITTSNNAETEVEYLNGTKLW